MIIEFNYYRSINNRASIFNTSLAFIYKLLQKIKKLITSVIYTS